MRWCFTLFIWLCVCAVTGTSPTPQVLLHTHLAAGDFAAISPTPQVLLHTHLAAGDLAAATSLLSTSTLDVNVQLNGSLPLQTLFRSWTFALTSWPPLPGLDSSYSALYSLLIAHKANASLACPLGPLLHCVRNRHMEGMRLLLGSGLSLPLCLATPDASGSVLLHYIAKTPAPGLAKVLTLVRGAPAQATASLAAALGFAGPLPPWPSSQTTLLKATVEAHSGSPEVELLAPHLLALPPALWQAALNSVNAQGLTPLDIACSHGRQALARWLQAAGGVCSFWPSCERAQLEAFEAQDSSATVALGAQGSTQPGRLHTPPSFSLQQHTLAGWHALAPAELQALGFPGDLLSGAAAGGAAAGVQQGSFEAVEELPLAALAPGNRGSLLRSHLLRGRPFIVRGPPANASQVLTPQALLRLAGGEGTAVDAGSVPYASQYGRGGERVLLRDFLAQHMGAAGAAGSQPSPPYVFDLKVLDGQAGALGALFSRRRQALFPGPPALSQLIAGPPRSGSALHFHPAAVNFCVLGVKAWVLLPPSAAGYADAGAEAWWRQELPRLQGQGGRVLQVLQGPSDMLFIPANWGHAVLNLADSVAMAYESIL